MSTLLSIGDFSRLTYLSVKALRHYDDVGLLRPADVDPTSGYRRYAAAQVPVAHVIRRFRDLEMPLGEIRAVLEAPDVAARDRAIVAHLERMQEALAQTQTTVASLKDLLDGRTPAPAPAVEFRSVGSTTAIGIRADVDWDDAERWMSDAFDEIHGALATSAGARMGPDAALYGPEFFEIHRGEVVAFVPVDGRIELSRRVERIEVAPAELAVIMHRGPLADLDQAYGALGTFVAERILSARGPIREHYLVTDDDTDDPGALRTEVCWPIRTIPTKESS